MGLELCVSDRLAAEEAEQRNHQLGIEGWIRILLLISLTELCYQSLDDSVMLISTVS